MSSKLLLCPVPVAHVQSALALAVSGDGIVAFGTGDPDGGGTQWEFFSKVPIGTPVLICVSETGGNEANKVYFHAGVCSLSAEYIGFEASPRKVKDIRPSSTGSDGEWQGYWLVKNLRQLGREEFVKLSDLGVKAAPRGPRNIVAPFDPHG